KATIEIARLNYQLIEALVLEARVGITTAKLRRRVGRGVITDDQFVIIEVLSQHALYRLRQVAGRVVGRDADADFRHIVYAYTVRALFRRAETSAATRLPLSIASKLQ